MKAIGWVTMTLALLFWAGIAWRLLRYPENHAGFNVLYAFPLVIAMIGVGAWCSVTAGRVDAQCALLLILGLLSAIAVALMYRLNVLLPYEVWLKRGMPPRPF